MRRVLLAVFVSVFVAAFAVGGAAQQTLDMYFIDVEGGQATLIVTPAHESLLIDTGWSGHEARDAKRIAAAAHLAGLSRIDYAVITHYHEDHVGGVPQLVAQIPVGTFLDHGPLYEQCPTCVRGFQAYMDVIASGKAKRRTVKPGEVLGLRGVKATVVSANGEVLAAPLEAPGAGAPNPFCAASAVRPDDRTENSHSVGLVLEFGKFRASDLGDLTWDKERALMCPVNRLGEVSLLIVSHHGWDQSSSPAYVAAVHPEVAIMDNGQTKGGSLPTFVTLSRVAGLKALWQLHHSDEAGASNAPEERIANLSGEAAEDQGFYLKVSARRDGSFTLFNARNGKSVSYAAR